MPPSKLPSAELFTIRITYIVYYKAKRASVDRQCTQQKMSTPAMDRYKENQIADLEGVIVAHFSLRFEDIDNDQH